MIIAYVGGIGSGKSLSMVRHIFQNKENYPISNFTLKSIKYHRIKYSDVVLKDKEGKVNVNWDFWRKMLKEHKRFSIYLDELANFAHARRAMTSKNQAWNRFFSQVRKITGDSEHNHLIFASQSYWKVDVELRELIHVIIECEKIMIGSRVLILNRVWEDPHRYELGCKHDYMLYFYGNPYFRKYVTTEMIHFGDDDYI